MDLKALYTQLILDESRNPCHRIRWIGRRAVVWEESFMWGSP